MRESELLRVSANVDRTYKGGIRTCRCCILSPKRAKQKGKAADRKCTGKEAVNGRKYILKEKPTRKKKIGKRFSAIW